MYIKKVIIIIDLKGLTGWTIPRQLLMLTFVIVDMVVYTIAARGCWWDERDFKYERVFSSH